MRRAALLLCLALTIVGCGTPSKPKLAIPALVKDLPPACQGVERAYGGAIEHHDQATTRVWKAQLEDCRSGKRLLVRSVATKPPPYRAANLMPPPYVTDCAATKAGLARA